MAIINAPFLVSAIVIGVLGVTSNAYCLTSNELVNKARSIYYQGKSPLAPQAEVNKEKLFADGLEAAALARQMEPDNPDAILWWVNNLSEYSLARGKFYALGRIAEIEQGLTDLKALNPQYLSAAADRGLGRLYQLAPPFISVGDRSKARDHYEQAIAIAPNFAGNLAYYADFLDSHGESAKAQELARRVLLSDDLRNFPDDSLEWTAIANSILDQPSGIRRGKKINGKGLR